MYCSIWENIDTKIPWTDCHINLSHIVFYYYYFYVHVTCPPDLILAFKFFCNLYMLTRLGCQISMNTIE